MSRVFNISFPFGNRVYNALVTVKAGGENPSVSLRVEEDQIHVLLPHGKLSFPIKEVVAYFKNLHHQKPNDMVMPITESISLHLMSPNW